MQIVIQTMYTFKYSYCSEKKSEKKKKRMLFKPRKQGAIES